MNKRLNLQKIVGEYYEECRHRPNEIDCIPKAMEIAERIHSETLKAAGEWLDKILFAYAEEDNQIHLPLARAVISLKQGKLPG